MDCEAFLGDFASSKPADRETELCLQLVFIQVHRPDPFQFLLFTFSDHNRATLYPLLRTMTHASSMQCPNFNALSVISFAAAVMSLTYSTIAIGGSIKAGKQPGKLQTLLP